MIYYLTVQCRSGGYIEYHREFANLDLALAHVCREYLKEPLDAIQNNAYMCINKGIISNIHISGNLFPFFQEKWRDVRIKGITISNEEALTASAALEASQADKN